MILLQKDVVSASEFSELFNVSRKTIQRDMESLSLANIPVYAMRGAEGGYTLMDEYKFDKRLLNVEDIENILIALGGFQHLITQPDIQATIHKIKGMVHTTISPNIDLSFYTWPGRSHIEQDVRLIMDAIKQHRLLTFEYVNPLGETSLRTVEPYKLRVREMHWYLFGYSLEREDFRTFKLTRMIDLDKGATFTPRSEINKVRETVMTESIEMCTVELLIDISVRDQFVERYGKDILKKEADGKYHVTLQLPENPFGYQFLAGFGNKVKIVHPLSYIQNYLHFLEETVKQYKNSTM